MKGMRRRIVIFLVMLAIMVAMPIIIFPLNSSVEDAQFGLAVELYREGRYGEAIAEFDRLQTEMKTKRYAAACSFYRGNAYLAEENFSAARAEFAHIVDTRSDSDYHGTSLYLLGRSEYMLGRHERAVVQFDAYVESYPSEEYADNSLYWRAESLLSLGEREQAREGFRQVLEWYPSGNKTDAARFKLKLMEMEDELAAREAAQPDMQETVAGATPEEIARWSSLEAQYQSEIDKLNNRIELLRTELDVLKEMGESMGDEREANLEERMKALVAWENILKIKEESLNQKEVQLDQEFERIQQLSNEFERIEIENE
jgi:TolA-binding protein